MRKFIGKCTLCRKYEAKLLHKPPSAPLPDFRSQCCDAFTFIGIDNIGPMFVYPTPRNKSSSLEKAYVVLYTCASTRAVHLDLVPDLSSSMFLNSFRRFTSRRGYPQLIISDNAKCFIGSETRNFILNHDIEWKFILAVSPWWGGFYERLVKSVKRPLRKILKRANITYDELLTILVEIEGVINCRPLCYLYSDTFDEVLTPSHLMTGRRLISVRQKLPTDISEESRVTLTNRLKYLRSLIGHYEKRWKCEYLTELRESQRSNNKIPAKQVDIGDVVLISDDKIPRNQWRLGRVVELMKSKDGHIRGCKLRVHNENRRESYLNRPVNKLCFFEVTSDIEKR